MASPVRITETKKERGLKECVAFLLDVYMCEELNVDRNRWRPSCDKIISGERLGLSFGVTREWKRKSEVVRSLH